jgi:hypothetical protein
MIETRTPLNTDLDPNIEQVLLRKGDLVALTNKNIAMRKLDFRTLVTANYPMKSVSQVRVTNDVGSIGSSRIGAIALATLSICSLLLAS